MIRDAKSHTGVIGFGDVVLSSRERPFPVEPMGSGLRGPRALVRRALSDPSWARGMILLVAFFRDSSSGNSFEGKFHMWSGYSVDKLGSYCAGGILKLWTQDPNKRTYWRVPGRFEKKELEDHLVELFPEGLSSHGWRYMLDRYDYIRDPVTRDAFVNHTWQVELTFEMVRRAAFPKMNSRFQSYFAWETIEAARRFRKDLQTIYRTQAEKGFRADQNWLTLGTQGVATSLCAHRYWSGAPSSESLWEIVLCAPVRIVDKVE